VDVAALEPAAPCLQNRPGKILTALSGVAYTENWRNSRSLKCPEVVPNFSALNPRLLSVGRHADSRPISKNRVPLQAARECWGAAKAEIGCRELAVSKASSQSVPTGFMVGSVPQSCLDSHTLLILHTAAVMGYGGIVASEHSRRKHLPGRHHDNRQRAFPYMHDHTP